ncbi:MAG: hypothetical protein K1564_06220 [Candidatus Thiodiazotropha sp. (ex. Lucinisca nassula)]|nr:hypothetical protein [Candidatus Thiodiazotropha sp. (ex. Lucinisca nassula)]
MFYIRHMLTIIILLVLVSCGGGGGGDDDILLEETDETEQNLSVSGYLFPEKNGSGLFLINASNGIGIPIPNTNWDSQSDTFPNGNFYKTPVDYDRSQFVVSARGCRYYSLAVDISCIRIQDYDGNYIGNFDLFYDVYAVRMSPDKAHVALFRNINPGSTDGEYLEIYNLSGDLLSDKLLETRAFQWHPTEGRIVYPRNNRELYFTKPYSTDGDYYFVLPDDGIDGAIYDFSISPDGMQVILIMTSNVTQFTSVQAKAYMMNIDGTGIRLLADVPSNREGYITDPSWSPDGRWVLLKEGYSAGQDNNTPGTSGYYYIVPTEDQGKSYTLSILASERSPEVIQFKRDVAPTNPEDQRLTDSALSGKLKWIP